MVKISGSVKIFLLMCFLEKLDVYDDILHLYILFQFCLMFSVLTLVLTSPQSLFSCIFYYDYNHRCLVAVKASFLNHQLDIFNSIFFQCRIDYSKIWNTNVPGPVFMKILVLRVAPSNNIRRKLFEMWEFPLKIKENILVKKKVIQKAS